MSLTTITGGNNSNVTINDNGSVLLLRTLGAGSCSVTINSGLAGFKPIEFSGQRTISFPASGIVNIAATNGSVVWELGDAASLGSQAIGAQPEDVLTIKQMQMTIAGTPIPLTGPTLQATNSLNNYTQISIINKLNGVNSSADVITYPDNGNDVAGWLDHGITSSGYNQAAYSVTGANEGYMFMSAPASSGNSGDFVYATDATGTSNGFRWYTNGFTKAIGAWCTKIVGASGLFMVGAGLSLSNLSKIITNIAAATTYTVPAGASYVNVTTSGASIATTFPAAAAAIDGLMITVTPGASVATATWVSTGATFIGAPAAWTANVPIRMIYDHASLKWYQC
jgi:hypothetical protein